MLGNLLAAGQMNWVWLRSMSLRLPHQSDRSLSISVRTLAMVLCRRSGGGSTCSSLFTTISITPCTTARSSFHDHAAPVPCKAACS